MYGRDFDRSIIVVSALEREGEKNFVGFVMVSQTGNVMLSRSDVPAPRSSEMPDRNSAKTVMDFAAKKFPQHHFRIDELDAYDDDDDGCFDEC